MTSTQCNYRENRYDSGVSEEFLQDTGKQNFALDNLGIGAPTNQFLSEKRTQPSRASAREDGGSPQVAPDDSPKNETLVRSKLVCRRVGRKADL